VQLRAPFDQYRVVRDLLREWVLEDIFGRHSPPAARK
jgi:hypothetical protein